MKVGRIEIGRGATVGTGSTILYDSKVGEFAQVRPLTMVMKGESIPAHSICVGSPAQPMHDRAPTTPAIDLSVRAKPCVQTALATA